MVKKLPISALKEITDNVKANAHNELSAQFKHAFFRI